MSAPGGERNALVSSPPLLTLLTGPRPHLRPLSGGGPQAPDLAQGGKAGTDPREMAGLQPLTVTSQLTARRPCCLLSKLFREARSRKWGNHKGACVQLERGSFIRSESFLASSGSSGSWRSLSCPFGVLNIFYASSSRPPAPAPLQFEPKFYIYLLLRNNI